MPDKELVTKDNNLLYCKEKFILAVGHYRRANVTNAADAPERTDPNFTKRIQKFQDQLKNGRVYSIPVKFLCSLGLANQCLKFNTTFTLMLETEMNKLFETNASNANPPATVDDDIIGTSAPYLQYERIDLDPNFRAYLESTLTANSFLRTGIQKTPYQKMFIVNISCQSHVVDL